MILNSEWVLTPFRALVHQPTATGIIADLHLGYAATRQAHGDAVPELGTELLTQRVLRLIADCNLHRIVIAGDLVEHGCTGFGAASAFVGLIGQRGVNVQLVEGNHDRTLPDIPGLERQKCPLEIGGWSIAHHVENHETHPCIMGHLHPVLRAGAFSGQAPCYLLTVNRVILPAQSEDAAGGSVFSWPEWNQAECHAIVHNAVLPLGSLGRLRKKLHRHHARC